MTGFQLATTIGLPTTALVVMVFLLVIARPDRDPEGNGVYGAYLATASVISLYVLLISAAALGEAVTQDLVGSAQSSALDGASPTSSYFLLQLLQGGEASIAIYAVIAALAAIIYLFHHRRRAELRASANFSGSAAARVDRAADAAICFTMIVLMFIGALVAAAAGYTFFSPPNHRDEIRDLSGGQLLSYGGLVVVAFFIFRARFWGIRGQDPEAGDGEPPLAELSER